MTCTFCPNPARYRTHRVTETKLCEDCKQATRAKWVDEISPDIAELDSPSDRPSPTDRT